MYSNLIANLGLPSHITLVLACKTRSLSSIEPLLATGLVQNLGENYVAEATAKYTGDKWLPLKEQYKVKLRLIGHLQSNKVATAVTLFDSIDSLDSTKLARKIDDNCSKLNKSMSVLLQYNWANEASKDGVVGYSALLELANYVLNSCPNLKLDGLMSMAPLGLNEQDSIAFFKAVKSDYDRLQSDINCPFSTLSMGMSGDYKLAIEAGANMVRIGSKLFGERG